MNQQALVKILMPMTAIASVLCVAAGVLAAGTGSLGAIAWLATGDPVQAVQSCVMLAVGVLLLAGAKDAWHLAREKRAIVPGSAA